MKTKPAISVVIPINVLICIEAIQEAGGLQNGGRFKEYPRSKIDLGDEISTFGEDF